MTPFNWLVRAAMWVRRPPSPQRVKLVVGVIAACLAIILIERLVGWPDWMSMDPARRFLGRP